MARIRSLKPEFWDDRKLARATCRDARMLYMGMWNQADEHGRLNGDMVWLKGRVFPYDDDITSDGLKGLLDELEEAGRIFRYEAEGDPFIHLPNLGKHQRLEPAKVESRLPEPPKTRGRKGVSEPRADKSEPRADQSKPDSNPAQDGARLSMDQVAGSREHGAGVPRADERAPTTQTIVAEWIEHCQKRPPGQVVGQVAKSLDRMLAEGIDPDDIRRGLAAWHARGLSPTVLPSFVNEVMNAPNGHGPPRRRTTDDKVRDGLELARRLATEQPTIERKEITG